jgi:S-adenosylmethionine hydrolase
VPRRRREHVTAGERRTGRRQLVVGVVELDHRAGAAGHLAAGVPFTELGSSVDPATLVPGLVALPEVRDDGSIVGEVWWVDHFGNCQLNIDPDELRAHGAEPGAPIELRFGEQARSVRWVHTYADAKPSELVLLVDSYGLASLALDRGSAAAECVLAPGSAVTLVPPGTTVSGREQEPS